jgi:hypothetical protein
LVVACGTQTTAFESFGGATGFASNTIQIYRGTGDGNFLTPDKIRMGLSSTSVSIADFDKDGSLDIAYNSLWSNGAGVQFGKNGNFYIAPRYIGAHTIRDFVVAGDFNLDGIVDFAGGFVNGPIAVAIGKPNNDYVIKDLNFGNSAEAILGDFNGDGFLDIAAFSGALGNQLGVGINQGDANFTYKEVVWNTDLAGQNRIPGLAVGDLNGDGLDDLVAPTYPYFNAHVFTATGDANVFSFYGFTQPASQGSCRQAIIADFSNRGIQDLALMCANLLIYKNDGRGNFASPVVINQLGSAARLSAGARVDINADGFTDIVAVTVRELNVFINNQAGGFRALPPIALPSDASSVLGADFNGDGYVDLVVPANPGFVLLKGTGSESFAAPKAYMGARSSRMTVTDVDGDGRPDLVIGTAENGMMIYKFQGCL